jgi:hypothetical protein
MLGAGASADEDGAGDEESTSAQDQPAEEAATA